MLLAVMRSPQILFSLLLLLLLGPNGLSAQAKEVRPEELDLAQIILQEKPAYLLLGELHDAKQQHAQRLAWLTKLAATLARPQGTLRQTPGLTEISLALEHLDSNRQAELDQFLAKLSPAEREDRHTAQRMAQAVGFNFKGWDWSFYEPVLQLALKMYWPIIASNLANTETLKIARGATAPMLLPYDATWAVADHEALAQQIRIGHCNALPESMIVPMSRAQRARDAVMASALFARRQGGTVIFLAGNGHVRKDLGVPRYLQHLEPNSRIVTVGLLEGEADAAQVKEGTSRFDLIVRTPVQEREDPCEIFKAPKPSR